MLFINELRFCLRQPLVLLSLFIMPLFAYLLSVGIPEGDYSPENQLHFTQFTLIILALPILLGMLSPVVYLRDTAANMTELIHSTPISSNKRWLLRYCAIVSLIMLIFISSFLITFCLYSLQMGFVTEFFTLTMLNLIFLVLPGVLFGTALALWLSIYLQSVMVIYVSFAVFGMGYLVLASMTGSVIIAGSSLVNDTFYNAMLWFDPYGLSAVLDSIKSANSYVSGELMANRLAYLLVSVALVYFTLTIKIKSKTTKKQLDTFAAQPELAKDQPRSKYWLPKSPLMQLIKIPLFTLLYSRVTQVILFIWPILIFNEVLSGIQYVEPLSVIVPNSIDALNRVAFEVLPVIGAFIIALWSWFICSRDKSCNIAELIAASPISNIQLVLAQVIALTVMLALLLLLTFVGSSIAELFAGSELLFHHYVVQLSLTGLPLLLLGTIFICIHHICRSSVISGIIIALILLIKFTGLATSLGMTHTLWNIADSPLQAPDNFWGYSASASVYLPYMTVWLAACISLFLLATNFSHRGTGLGRASIKHLPGRILVSCFITLFIGLNLHLSLISEKPLVNSDKREAWKAQYETDLDDWQHKPQPSVVHIDSKIDIYPEQQLANFKLSYTLENRTRTPIKQVLVGRYGNYGFGDITLDGATLVEFNADLNQGTYQFSQAILPNEQRILHAEFTFKQPQVWPHRSHQVVKPEFTYLRSFTLLPTIGYQVDYQLKNAQVRAKYNLKEIKRQLPSVLFKDETNNSGAYQWSSLSTVISTLKGHYAISQGELISSWQDNKRSYFKYQTKKPVRAIPAWLSVPYSAVSKTIKGTTINVYTPHKNQAAQLHIKAITDTLDWFAKHISPYNAAQLNLVATPDLGPAGYTLPEIILISEKFGFRAVPSSNAGFDQRYRRAVHETSHQWFGHGIGNGVPEDHSFLAESLVKYIELVLLEKHYGREAMLSLVEYEQKRFDLSERNNLQAPVALVDAMQDHDVYSRATLAFAKLRETVGDKAIIAALKSLWLQHAYPNTPATSMDFVRALKHISLQEHHSLINELLLSK